MKKEFAVVLSLFLLLVLVPQAVTNPEDSSYDPMSDVNRDKTIDAYDLNRLGKAYGSTQTIPTQPGKTTIYVYQLETDPPQIENARIAIIDPEYSYRAVQIGYTNSSGITAFTLNPNSNYTAIAWSKTTYNYANFTTNESGEASVTLQLGFSNLPTNWIVITIINATSRAFFIHDELYVIVEHLVYNWATSSWDRVLGASYFFGTFRGAFAIPHKEGFNETGHWVVYGAYGGDAGDYVPFEAGYSPDESGTANVVIYV